MTKKMMRFALPVAAALLAWACAGGAGDGGKKSDGFAKTAAQGGMAEVQMGKLASERGGSAAVKLFGQRMVDDHTKANMELNQLAARKNMQLPQELSAEQKSMLDKLSKLAGEDFDKEYVSAMVEDHEHDVEEFQTQSEKGDDPEVRAFAAKTLPTLRDHLQMIKDIKSKM
jgi:putative membrane protein